MYKRVQNNGSITIPAKLRKRLGMEKHQALEREEKEDGSIALKVYQPTCIWCSSEEDVEVFKGVQMCRNCYNKLRKD